MAAGTKSMVSLDLTFWFLWSLTGLATGYAVIRPLITGEELLGFPFIAGLAWLYFYVYMAFDVIRSLHYEEEIVPIEALCLGQFVALTSFLGIIAGWRAASRRRGTRRGIADHRRYNSERLWTTGLLFLAIGSIGQYTFIAQEAIDWRHTTAYWHMLFYIGYPGAALCIASLSKKPVKRREFRNLVLVAAVGLLLVPFLLNARRGPLFPAAVILTYAPMLFAGKKPNRAVVIVAMGSCGALMLLFIAIRPFIYSVDNYEKLSSSPAVSDAWRAGLSELSPSQVLLGKGARLGDNEYAYHCAAVWTLCQTGRYQYGTGDFSLLTHWIPRQLWPDKPDLEQGFFPSVVEEIPSVMGWTMTYGASWGGAANAFEEYGFLAPLFWALLAYFAKRTHQRALSHCLRSQITYLGFMAATHWLISQGFGAAFVPGCIFIIPPLASLLYARNRCKPSTSHSVQFRTLPII